MIDPDNDTSSRINDQFAYTANGTSCNLKAAKEKFVSRRNRRKDIKLKFSDIIKSKLLRK